MEKQLVLKPRLSEKTYLLGTAKSVYVFTVPNGASKQLIAGSVEAQFGVNVVSVNVANISGKTKRTVRKGSRPTMGKRSDIRKAYVTIKAGQSLPFFETEDDKKKKADKKTAKKEAK